MAHFCVDDQIVIVTLLRGCNEYEVEKLAAEGNSEGAAGRSHRNLRTRLR
jgi:hypothetical protein